MATTITLKYDGMFRVCRLKALDTVMLWLTHHPLDSTFFVRTKQAVKLADTGEAEITDGGTLRLWLIDGCPGCWVLSVRSRAIETSVHLDADMVDAFKDALRREAADATEEGREPGNGVGQHLGASA